VNAAVNPQESYQRTYTNRALTWLGTLQYDITDGVMAYYTMANGFKDNGFQVRPYNAANPNPEIVVGPEHTLNYELGAKAVMFDDKLLVNVDVYRMLIDGRQQNLIDPSGVGTTFILVNAGVVHQDGVELDAEAHPFEHLTLNGNMSYMDSVFAKFPNAPCISGYPYAGSAIPAGLPQPNPTYANKLCNQTGFTPSFSPKWLSNLSARWEQPWRDSQYMWYVTGSWSFTDSQHLDPTLDPRSYQPGYSLLDASIGFEPSGGNWKVDIFAKNLTNKAYFTAAAALGGAGIYNKTALGGFTPNGFMGFWGEPRTFGIEGSYKF
jgi:iron complex outermembrane receptor protein